MPDAFEIVEAKGAGLMAADLHDIEMALLDVPIDEHWIARGTVMSAVEAIVMRPDYIGDIDLDDLADE